jgi:hypothetical protein
MVIPNSLHCLALRVIYMIPNGSGKSERLTQPRIEDAHLPPGRLCVACEEAPNHRDPPRPPLFTGMLARELIEAPTDPASQVKIGAIDGQHAPIPSPARGTSGRSE